MNIDKHDVDEQTLIKLGKKYLSISDAQRDRAYNYYLKLKDTDEFKQRVKQNKQIYYQTHKDIIREKERQRYANDTAYHDQIRERARQKYLDENKDKPKLKRGRKPKPINENTISTPKGRGRPPLKPNDL